MNIVVLDGYAENPGDLSWEALAALGDLTVHDRTSLTDEAEAIARIGGAQVVYTNKTPITRRVLDACPGIRFIGVLATGYNVVDCTAARERGIPVSHVPTYGTDSVSQFAMALVLELCHHIGHHDRAVHQGRWTSSPDWCFWDYPLMELAGKTMGILGFGRIGQRTGALARAFGMEVLAFDAQPSPAGRSIGTYVPLEALLAAADVLVLHCPLLPATQGVINASTIAQMKSGALLVNNSRGPLVVEADLAAALHSGKLAGAALDVVSTEPICADNPLLSAPNCIITPHISWAPRESRQRIMDCSVENLRCFLAGAPIHVVNP